MGIRVALYHGTVYEYDRLVTLSPQTVRLRPAPHSRTVVTSYSMRVDPQQHFINWQQDPQGNFMARLVFPNQTRRFALEVSLVAEMTVINPFDFFLEPYAERYPFPYEDWERRELRPYLETLPAGPRMQAFLASLNTKESHTIDFLVELNGVVQRHIGYVIRLAPGVQTPEETLELRKGSCRDSGWLLVQVLRHLGLAARFVSGYLIQLKPDVKSLDGPPGPEMDFTDLHAWAEVYLPGAGWIGLDPTSGLFAGEGHIPLAATPEPQSAAPISGRVSASEVKFHHEMRVTRIHEDPRVTSPYTEEQWKNIDTLGRRVDLDLAAGDVRLTMGGEPTFISIDDIEDEEWKTAALGPAKRRISVDLVKRLRDKFAPGGHLHFGLGKWYPGESLPRWAFTCYWRTDGLPLWKDPRWTADPNHHYDFDTAAAQRFARTLSERLSISAESVITAYEDPMTSIVKEGRLPHNVDPVNNKLDDPEERDRMRRLFERGLGHPAAFVLPLKWNDDESGPEWQTSPWPLRSPYLFLLTGDSPAGLRLPLHALPWEPDEEKQTVRTIDPMAPMTPLPNPKRLFREGTWKNEVPSQRQTQTSSVPARGEKKTSLVRTALVVELREKALWVFLPPLSSAEEYVELLAAIEDTAASLEMPVLVEGYSPPYDPRLRKFSVTPDPGVIEVNIHPAATWDELVENTTILYEEARQSRLGTEKFMVDGRHTGTGGGNHIVLGGATPADSPFLRRPDLLKSFVGYWLNHPALSYLFSGVFVGPTSQAPRIDETRADSIYELEIAFSLLGEHSESGCPPWLVDRIFRNLLVDVTGNTHRAEFCIDKLYSPDSTTGRLGLLELRAFEMPPHSRMSLAQQLLVRALLAWFWRQPYEEKPIRWGTRLHDQFLLPYFVEQDFGHVIADLQRAGYTFEPSCFAPHAEFRFPVYGRVCYQGVEVELRQAIEPWYVLGEEQSAGGTARYVDSSVERLQVRVRGLVGERHAVTCNGRRLPLHPTGTHGDFVCGVRYRAWQPPHCLHPTIPVHTPLVFDVLDASIERAIGGCTYHVAHPGGRNYQTLPVNSNEAEGRRMARFFGFGHTPGPICLPPAEVNPEFPATLDLRRAAALEVARSC